MKKREENDSTDAEESDSVSFDAESFLEVSEEIKESDSVSFDAESFLEVSEDGA